MYVLIVEDDAAIREVVAEVLAEAAYEVGTAENGDIALRMVLERRPDLLVVDMVMPMLSGRELLAELHDLDVRVPAIAMTASPARLVGVVADRVLLKPFSMEEILAAVQEVAAAAEERAPWPAGSAAGGSQRRDE